MRGHVVGNRAARPGKIAPIEGLRGLAASYVFAHHVAHVWIGDALPRVTRLFRFGQAAVLVFFILSGFVIHHSTFARGSPPPFRVYLLRRFRRIYPLFALSLALSYVAESLSLGALAPVSWPVLLGNLLMLQDYGKVGNWVAPYCENGALWSLSYEWFFYLAYFPIATALRARPGIQAWIVGAIGLAGFALHTAWPNQISLFAIYFPLWWVGAEIAREYLRPGSFRVRSLAPTVGVIASFTLLWALLFAFGATLGFPAPPGLELRHFLSMLGLLALALAWWRLDFSGIGVLAKAFAPLGAISYGIYVLHTPVLLVARRYALTQSRILDLALWIVPTVLALAYLAEIRLQPLVNRFFAGADRRERLER